MTLRTPSPSSRPDRRAGAGGGVIAVALGAALLLGAPDASAQSARAILTEALEAGEQRLAGVENLTIRQEVMGVSTTTYMVKEMVDGYPALRARSVDAMGMDVDLMEDAWDVWADPRAIYGAAPDEWTLEGAGSMHGRATWRLVLSDMDVLDWDNDPGLDQEAAFEAQRLVLELDQERLIPLRMELEGEMTDEEGARPMTVVMSFSDYRTVDGYLHPFLTLVEMDLGASGLSPEEIEEARAAMADFQRELERAPAAQREMMERMLGDQMAVFEQMLSGEGIRIELRVTELLVNQGPPEGG